MRFGSKASGPRSSTSRQRLKPKPDRHLEASWPRSREYSRGAPVHLPPESLSAFGCQTLRSTTTERYSTTSLRSSTRTPQRLPIRSPSRLGLTRSTSLRLESSPSSFQAGPEPTHSTKSEEEQCQRFVRITLTLRLSQTPKPSRSQRPAWTSGKPAMGDRRPSSSTQTTKVQMMVWQGSTTLPKTASRSSNANETDTLHPAPFLPHGVLSAVHHGRHHRAACGAEAAHELHPGGLREGFFTG